MEYAYSPIVKLEQQHLQYQMVWNPEFFSTGFNPIGNGWSSKTLNAGWDTSSIQEIQSPIGSKTWRGVKTSSGTDLYVIGWDQGPKNVRDVEVLSLQRYSATTPYGMGNFHRQADSGASLTGYFLGFRNNTTEIRRRTWVNGAGASFEAYFHELGNPVNRWFWIRSQTIGTSIKLKVWEYGTLEPDWQLVGTDSQIASGFVGYGDAVASGTTLDIAWYSVGVNGLPAPFDFSDMPLQAFIQTVESDGARYTITGSLSDFGDVFAVATLPFSGTPSVEQIIDGEDSSGDPARGAGSQTGVNLFNFDITGTNLEDNPSHQIHVVGRKIFNPE